MHIGEWPPVTLPGHCPSGKGNRMPSLTVSEEDSKTKPRARRRALPSVQAPPSLGSPVGTGWSFGGAWPT